MCNRRSAPSATVFGRMIAPSNKFEGGTHGLINTSGSPISLRAHAVGNDLELALRNFREPFAALYAWPPIGAATLLVLHHPPP